ncbi:MAG TPA: hypothetical protein VFK30_05315 [Anaerolineae bacterium]|nr:hypothetical protein [Anaerolineae bacterium]
MNNDLLNEIADAALAAAEEVGEPAIKQYDAYWHGVDEAVAATIERCAHEAEQYPHKSCWAIADKIRALNAAAEAGEQPDDIGWYSASAARLKADMIERCAQVAETRHLSSTKYADNPYEDVAAAIRALKDKP